MVSVSVLISSSCLEFLPWLPFMAAVSYSAISPVLPTVLLVMVVITPMKNNLGQEETLVASGRRSYPLT